MTARRRGTYIVDVEGFKTHENIFIVKEIAVYSMDDDTLIVHMFKEPCEWNYLKPLYKAVNSLLFYNFHAIHWNDGLIPYEMAHDTINSLLANAEIIYVKGNEKVTCLKEIIGDNFVFNVEKLRCPSLAKLDDVKCSHHRMPRTSCAQRNVQLLVKWFKENTFDEIE